MSTLRPRKDIHSVSGYSVLCIAVTVSLPSMACHGGQWDSDSSAQCSFGSTSCLIWPMTLWISVCGLIQIANGVGGAQQQRLYAEIDMIFIFTSAQKYQMWKKISMSSNKNLKFLHSTLHSTAESCEVSMLRHCVQTSVLSLPTKQNYFGTCQHS